MKGIQKEVKVIFQDNFEIKWKFQIISLFPGK